MRTQAGNRFYAWRIFPSHSPPLDGWGVDGPPEECRRRRRPRSSDSVYLAGGLCSRWAI